MKRLTILLLACVLMISCTTAAWAQDMGRSYLFELSVDGKDMRLAQPGDTVTVTFYLRRTDGGDPGPMYAMQNEISYDTAFFTPVEGSVLASRGIRTTVVDGTGGTQRLYMNFLSTEGGEDWPDDRLVGSFQLRVTAAEGAGRITNENYLVSTADGMARYAAKAQDVTVALSEAALQEAAGPQNDGPVSSPPLGLWLVIAAAALLVLYGRKRADRK